MYPRCFFIFIISLFIVACSSGQSGGSSSPQNSTSIRVITPVEYPVGVATTAYITLTNDLSIPLNNLEFVIPTETNHTGVNITVVNNGAPCNSIPAHDKCSFAVDIPSGSTAGSFTINAIYGQTSSISKSNQVVLSTTIGLTQLPVNNESNANGITFLYAPTVIINQNGDSYLAIVAIVNSTEVGVFNTLNLTNSNGELLDFNVLSGNSGAGATDLSYGDVVTLLLKVPAGSTSSYTFYAQTMKDGVIVNTATHSNSFNLSNTATGILVASPTKFVLSVKDNKLEQMITYTNIGSIPINDLAISLPDAENLPVSITNNCSSTLNAYENNYCSVIIKLATNTEISGSSTVLASSSGGSVVSQFNYLSINPIAELTISAENNFNFITNTVNNLDRTQVTLTNLSEVTESGFSFHFDKTQYFEVTSGLTGIPCDVSNNRVTNLLPAKSSCTVTLTYSNTALVNGIEFMHVSYYYDNKLISPITIGLNYHTTQATASLSVFPEIHDFGTIIANNVESLVYQFRIVNNGIDSTKSLLIQDVTGMSNYFSVLPAMGNDDCQVKQNLAANGGFCTLNVSFGPSAVESSIVSAVLPIEYASTTGGGNQITRIGLSGVARAPISANPQIIAVESKNITAGTGTTGGDSFQIESSVALTSELKLIYTNTGLYPAFHFTVNNAPNGYNIMNNTCYDITLESNSSNQCFVILTPNSNTIGIRNIIFTPETLYGSWTDERGSLTTQRILWRSGNRVVAGIYVNIFQSAFVTAVLSSESTGSIIINDPLISESFYVVFTLNGGYRVPETTYRVTLPNSQTTFNVSPDNCTLSSAITKCNVKIVPSAESSESNVMSLVSSSALNPVPSTIIFNVVKLPTYYVFIAEPHVANFGGLDGANQWCESSANKPTGSTATYMAGLVPNAPFTPNRRYTTWYNNQARATFSTASTSASILSNSFFRNMILNSVPESSRYTGYWIGYTDATCLNWTTSVTNLRTVVYMFDSVENLWTYTYTNCGLNASVSSNANLGIACIAQTAESE